MTFTSETAATSNLKVPRPVAVIDGFSKLLALAGALGVTAIVMIMNFEIVARNWFNAPTTWSVEMVTYLVVATAFLPLALLQKEGGQIRVEMVVDAVRPSIRLVLTGFSLLISYFFVSIMTWQYAIYLIKDYQAGARDWGLLQTPLWIPQLPVLVGLTGFCLALLADLLRRSGSGSAFRGQLSLGLVAATYVVLALLGMRPVFFLGRELDYGTVLIFATCVALGFVNFGGRVTAAFTATIVVLAVAAFLLAGSGAGPIGTFVGVATLLLLLTGMPISVAIGITAFAGLYFFLPIPQLSLIADRPWRSLNSYTYSAIPMFILMGCILVRSGATDRFFGTIAGLLGRTPGGLAHAGLLACGMFSAVSGSSIATSATVGQVAAPEMLKRGYSRRLALGSIAGGGTLGILIPPSIPMIVYGATVGVPVLALFAAGIIPGLMVLASMMLVVLIWGWLYPDDAPPAPAVPWRHRLRSLQHLLPVLVLIASVLGALYSGVVTPTEAGALGVVMALVLAAFEGRLSTIMLRDSVIDGCKLTAAIMFIVVATSILTWVLDYARVPHELVATIETWQLSPFWLLLMIGTLYLILGMFIDPISMMLMTVSVTYPIILLAGYDAIWFGVALMIIIEVGLITPPVGMILFVLRGLFPEVPLRDVVQGAFPFVVVIIADVVLICIFPEIVTWLPSVMSGR